MYQNCARLPSRFVSRITLEVQSCDTGYVQVPTSYFLGTLALYPFPFLLSEKGFLFFLDEGFLTLVLVPGWDFRVWLSKNCIKLCSSVELEVSQRLKESLIKGDPNWKSVKNH